MYLKDSYIDALELEYLDTWEPLRYSFDLYINLIVDRMHWFLNLRYIIASNLDSQKIVHLITVNSTSICATDLDIN